MAAPLGDDASGVMFSGFFDGDFHGPHSPHLTKIPSTVHYSGRVIFLRYYYRGGRAYGPFTNLPHVLRDSHYTVRVHTQEI
jgi:hypothetical protein